MTKTVEQAKETAEVIAGTIDKLLSENNMSLCVARENGKSTICLYDHDTNKLFGLVKKVGRQKTDNPSDGTQENPRKPGGEVF